MSRPSPALALGQSQSWQRRFSSKHGVLALPAHRLRIPMEEEGEGEEDINANGLPHLISVQRKPLPLILVELPKPPPIPMEMLGAIQHLARFLPQMAAVAEPQIPGRKVAVEVVVEAAQPVLRDRAPPAVAVEVVTLPEPTAEIRMQVGVPAITVEQGAVEVLPLLAAMVEQVNGVEQGAAVVAVVLVQLAARPLMEATVALALRVLRQERREHNRPAVVVEPRPAIVGPGPMVK